MKKTYIDIPFEGRTLPAIIWGAGRGAAMLCVHGRESNKEDVPIALCAEMMEKRGGCAVSFDLPEHGVRKNEKARFDAMTCVPEVTAVYRYVRGMCKKVFVFGCSIGAQFAMTALQNEEVAAYHLLSPLLDLRGLIEWMMRENNVDLERLNREKVIALPNGEVLDAAYYAYVCAHPITLPKHPRVRILYGMRDDMTNYDTVRAFADRVHASVTISSESEHWFHTKEDVRVLREWLEEGGREDSGTF